MLNPANLEVYTIYKVTNLVNSKFYIGLHKTKNPNDEYLGSGLWIQRSIQKYGRSNFQKEILHILLDRQEAYNKEKEVVELYRGIDPKCMNIMPGGLGGFILYHTEKTKTKLSISATGKKHSEETLLKMSRAQKGRRHSEETKNKIGEANRGKIRSDELKARISKAVSNPSVETRRKISEANIGKKLSEEHKASISSSKQGHQTSEETKRKLAKARQGKKHTEEAIAKMREAKSEMWRKRKEALCDF